MYRPCPWIPLQSQISVVIGYDGSEPSRGSDLARNSLSAASPTRCNRRPPLKAETPPIACIQLPALVAQWAGNVPTHWPPPSRLYFPGCGRFDHTGTKQFTRILYGPSSMAAGGLMPRTASFEAAYAITRPGDATTSAVDPTLTMLRSSASRTAEMAPWIPRNVPTWLTPATSM